MSVTVRAKVLQYMYYGVVVSVVDDAFVVHDGAFKAACVRARRRHGVNVVGVLPS